MESLLSVRGLTKSFKGNQVLCGIGFDVIPGEVLCILGPNGAGKSTTINILTTTLAADKGEIRFGGKPITGNLRAYKQQLGIVPQDIAPVVVGRPVYVIYLSNGNSIAKTLYI